MKKIVILIVLMCAMAGAVFAQSYAVQSVTGRVQREAGGSRVDVKAGDILTGETIIITGIGASMMLKDGNKIFSVPSARNGKLVDLVVAASAVRVTSGNVIRTDTSAVSRTTGQVSTASARASDAAGDEDIAAE